MAKTDVPGAVGDFQKYLKQQQLLPTTREKYAEIISSAGGKNLLRWIESRVHARMPLGTVLPLRAAVKHYLMAEQGYTEEELKLLLPKARGLPAARRHPLSPTQLALYYAAVDEITAPVPRAILRLLPRTGLRISEMTALRPENIQVIEGTPYLVFRGKRGKERVVPLGGTGTKVLEEYSRQIHVGKWLFPGGGGRHITPHAVRKYTRRLRERYPDLGATLSPHVLRATYSTLMVKNGVSLLVLQQLLGHENIATTQRYVTPDRDMLRAAVDTLDAPSTE